MKKIFFVFAMMFLPFISAMAEESSELSEILYLADPLVEDGDYTYTGSCFVVKANDGDYWGMYINGENKITVRSKTGEKITKVECNFSYGLASDRKLLKATPGDVSIEDFIIDNVNATELVIYSDATGRLEIDELVVYYEPQGNGGEEENTSISEEYIQFESFATTNGTEYLGNNVQVTGAEANANGLSIDNGKIITISQYNDNDVRILKVELEFENEFNGTINGLGGCVIEGSGTSKTISNFYSPTITISCLNGSGQIKNITVYYVKMSEEKHVTIDTTTGKNDYIEGEGHIKVSGTESVNEHGLNIDEGEYVTITSVKGAEISKVDLDFSYYYGSDSIRSTAGTRVIRNVNPIYPNRYWAINDVNSSSLTISHPGESENEIQISEITVYYKEPVPNSTMELVANAAEGFYWTTFYSNASNYQAPEGTQVFKVSLDGRKITMTEIEDRIVNRYEGVVLKSTTPNITMTKTDDHSYDNYAGNSLKGTAYKITNPGNAYVLSYKSSAGVAFYRLSNNGTIAANKAYLKFNSSSAAHEFFTFDFDTTATGVDSINTQDSEENADVKIYDLQGRRVANPGKGIYIVNGKKVLMK